MAMTERFSRVLAVVGLAVLVSCTDLMETPAKRNRVSAASVPERSGLTLPSPRPMADGYLPRPVGLLPDSNHPVPGDALFVSPRGDDAAPGTELEPMRTVTAAVDRVRAEGTIVLRGGNYRESVPLIRKRITLQPYPHEQVWMKGSDVHTAWTKYGRVWVARDWTSPFCHDCFHPLAIDPDFPMAGWPEQVFVNGNALRQVATTDALGPGSFFVDPVTRAMIIGDDPTNAVVELSTRWRALQLEPEAAGSIIRGIGFSDYSPHWNEDQLAAVIVNAAFVRLEGNAFVRNAGTAVSIVHQPMASVVGNVIVSNGYRGMNMYMAHGSVVRQNRFETNNTERFANTGCNEFCTVAGFKAAAVADLVVDNNDFTGNQGNGLWCDMGCTDSFFTRNIVTGNIGSGIVFEISSRAAIAGNFIMDNATDPEATTSAGVKIASSADATVFDNTFVGNRRQIGVYEDARSATEHPYSRALGLSWDTVRVGISVNAFIPDGDTDRLFNSNGFGDIGAAQMLGQTEQNRVDDPESQYFYWATGSGQGEGYDGLAEFEFWTGRDFGL
jgi:hypothetical protein